MVSSNKGEKCWVLGVSCWRYTMCSRRGGGGRRQRVYNGMPARNR